METKLNVKLLRYTPNPEMAVATAARLCYNKSDIPKLLDEMTEEKCGTLLKKLVELGHESPFEHASFTFGVEGISRACTHQLVRHRIASYSQQSQRYVDAKDFKYIVPPSIKKDPGKLKKFNEIMNYLNKAYAEMEEIAPKEDARFVLPNAIETKIIITMNARELKHFFTMRCCNRAQWEIREMATTMLKEAKKVAPIIFKNSGPSCVRGPCREGAMSCGKIEEVRRKFKDL